MNVSEMNDRSIRAQVASDVWDAKGVTIDLDASRPKFDPAEKFVHELEAHAVLTIGEKVLHTMGVGGASLIMGQAGALFAGLELLGEAHENAAKDAKAYQAMRYETDCIKFLEKSGLLTNKAVVDGEFNKFKAQHYDAAKGSDADVQKMETTPELAKMDLSVREHFLMGEKLELEALKTTDPAERKKKLDELEIAKKNDYPLRLGAYQVLLSDKPISEEQIDKQLAVTREALAKLK